MVSRTQPSGPLCLWQCFNCSLSVGSYHFMSYPPCPILQQHYRFRLFCLIIFQLHFLFHTTLSSLPIMWYHFIFSFSSVIKIVQMQDGVRRRRSAEPRGRTEGWQVQVSCKPSLMIFLLYNGTSALII